MLFGRAVPHRDVPERAASVLRAIRAAGLGAVTGPRAHGLDALTAIHSAELVEFLSTAAQRWAAAGHPLPALPHAWPRRGHPGSRPPRTPGQCLGYFASDTCSPVTEGTWAAARAAADCALTGAELLAGAGEPVFALCRPPGHHAGPGYFGGYCYLNNAALAAGLLAGRGATAILDIDYHHGNGTQDIFWDRADVGYVSVHAGPDEEYPFYSGHRDEAGGGPGRGATRNHPLPAGATVAAWLAAFRGALADIRSLAPAYLVVSLGTDTAAGDPIGTFGLTRAEYALIGTSIAGLGIPALYVLEGGYQADLIGSHVVSVLPAHERAAGRQPP